MLKPLLQYPQEIWVVLSVSSAASLASRQPDEMRLYAHDLHVKGEIQDKKWL